MISLYTGTPGSGKSLDVAQKIIRWLRTGKYMVICNFEINLDMVNEPDMFFYVPNSEMTPELLQEFSAEYFSERKFKESQILLVIDEAQLIFNVREWNMKGREKWIHFFTQHRKLGYDVVLVCQFDRMIDKQIRSLVEYEYIHRKVSNFGWKGKLFSVWTGNRLFFVVKRWYPLHETVGTERFLYKKKLGDFYNTTAIFEKPNKPQQDQIHAMKQVLLGEVQVSENVDDSDIDIEVINF